MYANRRGLSERGSVDNPVDGKTNPVIRLLIIVPLLLSPAIIGADWAVMLNRESGIIDYLLSLVHLPQISFLTSGTAVLPTLDGVYVWQNLGFTLIVVTAGLANIPRELTDAVVIDGATYVQRLRYLVLPMLLPFFGIIVFWRFVTLIEDYGLVGLLTGGWARHRDPDRHALHLCPVQRRCQ